MVRGLGSQGLKCKSIMSCYPEDRNSANGLVIEVNYYRLVASPSGFD